jgi:hypothetical protein
MTACNARPPAGHPFHRTGVACHLDADHVLVGAPHSWDIDAVAARHDILTRAIGELRRTFPGRKVEKFDVQLPHPIMVYDVDPHTGERAPHPYRSWDTIAGPWLLVTFEDAELADRRASAPEQIDNASLPAGSPMHYYYCQSCGHLAADLPAGVSAHLTWDWWRDPPPVLCDWCRTHESPEFAIWKATGAVYRVGLDGVVDEEPIIAADPR